MTTIHFFASPGNPQPYGPDRFIYGWGSFLTSVDQDGSLRLILHAHEVDWYDTNHNDILGSPLLNDSLAIRATILILIQAALPTVSLLGIVRSGGGQLNSRSNLLHYDLETNVYNVSNKVSVTFTVSIYFRNGNRWTNFPVLARQSRIFITGRILGITADTPPLAIGVDDVYFIPNLGSITTSLVTPTSSAGTQKQAVPRISNE
ncbi:uncharacterized protein N7473_011895 [Penicillium subrubescens]|uniref:uncharacterized protein n=1 Tax=Penicillium subrubescens TaxID=1316194 RepID=UPI0025451FF4|nr:uncharacterized protein N7473_011895 [Penicillium subrubescens]KAJ5880842.1 hypothetical protein N7473_011895 [Penicillium subrubescens]